MTSRGPSVYVLSILADFMSAGAKPYFAAMVLVISAQDWAIDNLLVVAVILCPYSSREIACHAQSIANNQKYIPMYMTLDHSWGKYGRLEEYGFLWCRDQQPLYRAQQLSRLRVEWFQSLCQYAHIGQRLRDVLMLRLTPSFYFFLSAIWRCRLGG